MGKAQDQSPIQLSEASAISVITMGPDQRELYAAFGHNAIRVVDPANDLDLAYNYGIFDFDQPNFYVNYARGYLYFKLGVNRWPDFQRYYEYYGRFIHEQVLDLSLEERQQLFDYLQNNALPKNAGYFYDYFYDNCATRVRDVIIEVYGDRVRFDGSYITQDRTIRELTDLYLHGEFPWGDLGIDLCLGLPMDREASPFQHMFLPDYIESGFEHAYIASNSGEEKPLVKEIRNVYPGRVDPPARSTFFTPSLVFWAIGGLMVIFSWIGYSKGKSYRGIDIGLFAVTGFLGLFLTALWFLTDHNAAAYNFNILWAFPGHLIVAFAILRNSAHPFWRNYLKITAIAMVLLLVLWPVLPQMLHYSLIPIVIAIGFRAGLRGYIR